MIRSMTGYGSHKITTDNFEIKMDLRSVNNRYLDIIIRAPKSMLFIEDDLKKIISNKISRGKIDVFIDIKFIGDYDINLSLDYNLAEKYKLKLNELSEYLNINESFNVFDLVNYDQKILSLERMDLSENSEFIDSCLECIDIASSNLLEMKSQEGYNIVHDLKGKLDDLALLLDIVEGYSKTVVEANIEALKSRITEFLNKEEVELDKDRLVNEIVFYSDKMTIDEEIVRLKSHIDLFEKNLNNDYSTGKKLDFLTQEMNRETNTIGSKSASINITDNVIQMKTIIEKIREQVQNIE